MPGAPAHDSPAGPERTVLVAVVVVAALIGTALVALGPDRSASSDVVAAAVRVARPTVAPLHPATRPPAPTTTVARSAARAPATSTSTSTTTAPSPPTTTTLDPGTLPQTQDRPTASGAQFDSGVQGLWDAIVTDDPAAARPFFFPQTAYVQVKAISDPVGDYQNRLIANYDQDIHTLHAQLGADASAAKLVGLTVPDDQAVWVQPGEEYNKGSYWRVYGSTLHFTVDGADRSLPVTSLISWRGQWYVVHLGQIR